MEDKVKVIICGEMRAIFHQEIEMERSEFDRINNDLDDEQRSVRRAAERDIEGLLDCSDILDLDDFELEEFHVKEVQPNERSN